MERNLSLEMIQSHPDLVIRIKDVTLGEENRNKMESKKRKLEKTRVTEAACALLNSGGGVIEIQMANKSEHPVERGLDLDQSLRELIQSSDWQAFFETQHMHVLEYWGLSISLCPCECSPNRAPLLELGQDNPQMSTDVLT